LSSENSDISIPIADGSRSILVKKSNNVLTQLNDMVSGKKNLPIFNKFHRKSPILPCSSSKEFQEDMENSIHYTSFKNEDPYGEGLRKLLKREKIVTTLVI
jgi:hypothetical protein